MKRLALLDTGRIPAQRRAEVFYRWDDVIDGYEGLRARLSQ